MSKELKNEARRLGKYLTKHLGLELKHSQLLEALAAAKGYADWNTLAAKADPEQEEPAAPELDPGCVQVVLTVEYEPGTDLDEAAMALERELSRSIQDGLLGADYAVATYGYSVDYADSYLLAYRVTVTEDGDTFDFCCMAEDDEHAEEQALNAYPSASIVTVCLD